MSLSKERNKDRMRVARATQVQPTVVQSNPVVVQPKSESVIPDKYLAARFRLALIIREQLNTT